MVGKLWQRILLTSWAVGSTLGITTIAAQAGSRPLVVPTSDSTGTNAGVNHQGFSTGLTSVGNYAFTSNGAPRFLINLENGQSTTIDRFLLPSRSWQVTRSTTEAGGVRLDIGLDDAKAIQAAFQKLSPAERASFSALDQPNSVLSSLPPDVKAAIASLRIALEQPTPNSSDIGTSLNNALAAYLQYASAERLQEPLPPDLVNLQNALARLRRQLRFSR